MTCHLFTPPFPGRLGEEARCGGILEAMDHMVGVDDPIMECPGPRATMANLTHGPRSRFYGRGDGIVLHLNLHLIITFITISVNSLLKDF